MKPIAWTLWAIVALTITTGVLLAWQLGTLSPSAWCGVSVGAAAVSGQTAPTRDCTSILLAILGIKDHAIWMLGGALMLAFVVIVVTQVKARVHVDGPGGLGLNLGGEGTVDIQATGTIKPAEEPKA